MSGYDGSIKDSLFIVCTVEESRSLLCSWEGLSPPRVSKARWDAGAQLVHGNLKATHKNNPRSYISAMIMYKKALQK